MNSIIVFFLSFLFAMHSYAQECDFIPELNAQIVNLAESKIGKKVDRGECWDVADYVLRESNAQWDGMFEYGRRIDPSKECIFPGDIIQFEKVRLEYEREGINYVELMKQHTAIVYTTENQDELTLLHQNVDEHGKKVGESPLQLSTITKGKILIYRPIPSQ